MFGDASSIHIFLHHACSVIVQEHRIDLDNVLIIKLLMNGELAVDLQAPATYYPGQLDLIHPYNVLSIACI